jgi:uncharacterized protein
MPVEPFPARLVRFGDSLRTDGLEVGPARLQDAIVALTAVDPLAREDVYWALRCTLCSHHDHLELFDAAFDPFWRGLRSDPDPRPEPKLQLASEEGGQREMEGGEREEDLGESDDEPDAGEDFQAGLSASSAERLLTLDFRQYSQQELRDVRRVIDRIAKALPRRRSLRLEPANKGRRLDLRRTLREAMRTGGHFGQREWRRNRMVPRRTVFLLDISGSMSSYSRVMMMFAQAAVRAGRRVEVFCFGTRLTRVTDELMHQNRDRGLANAARAVPDWAGGTRIASTLKDFNETWGRRSGTRGAVVIVVSDGWEHGDPGALKAEMEKLHRACHALVWINPLAGDVGYQPVSGGMAAALPHVDAFLPGNNLASLMSLADVLEQLSRRHGTQVATTAAPRW